MTADVGVGSLLRLTTAKLAANFAVRWVPFFLPTLAAALSATTGQLTVVLGVAELAGLATLAVGRQLDRGREVPTMVVALGLISVGASLALVGWFPLFAVGQFMATLGAALCTVGGHAWLSRRVAFARRARAIGLFETSWALALLIGAPVAALLIGLVGWRGPLVAVTGAAVLAGVMLVRGVDGQRRIGAERDRAPTTGAGGDGAPTTGAGGDGAPTPGAEALASVDAPIPGRSLGRDAWLAIGASAAIAVTGLTTIVIAGTWLDESLGVSTGGVGAVAMAFGLAELVASSSSAALADRIGPGRAARTAVLVAAAGLLVMTGAGASLPVGAGGLLLFFLGFEFAIVTSFTVVSEAVPSAQGQVLATNMAVGTLLRGLGVMASGALYEAFGIAGPAGLSLASAAVAVILLTAAFEKGIKRG